MKTFLFFLFIIFFTAGAMASGFSPSSLTFNLEQNQESCQTIHLDSNSETITAKDVWAENKDVQWDSRLFDTNAEEHGITISYANNIPIDERDIEVCISGENEGEYHGDIIFEEEQEGNSIIQMGIWLKVFISGDNQATSGGSNGGQSSGSSSSGSSSSSGNTFERNQINSNSEKLENDESEKLTRNDQSNQNTEDKNKITGNFIGNSGKIKSMVVPLFTLFIAGLLIFTYFKRKKR